MSARVEDPTTYFDVRDRVVVVTGAGRGIGRWIAEHLGAAGAQIVAASRTVSESEAVAQRIRDHGGSAVAFQVDIAEPAQCQLLIDRTADELGTVDVLINNAGATSRRIPALKIDEQEYARTLDINVRGTFFASRAAAEVMISNGRGGRIVNFASTAAQLVRMGVPNSVYAAAKSAVIAMTRGLAVEWAEHGINVNCIAPGRFLVERNAQFMQPGSHELDVVMKSIPMGRTGGAEDMLGPVLFLASDASRYVTGQTLFVDGGRTTL